MGAASVQTLQRRRKPGYRLINSPAPGNTSGAERMVMTFQTYALTVLGASTADIDKAISSEC